MITKTEEGEKEIMTGTNKEMQEEMVGVLTAISIVSKRLAKRLLELDEEKSKKGEKKDE
ncbi:hypothetical protein [Alkaliphilus peptidifermentans]|uniref:Uncharacterized protein n=1 Tax=Alkaliphilus peptidifermentans DSM 18978 TaxID=1120976 RepID=A0A1G5EHG6_9FIRM|nr:hypothetical protein [Alkaliphilus peptidifermentans]SCY26453.1 hypothetical protein SAMN03080606_01162 [Alkaliphilus peptidifermentans DSM 18978]